MQVSPFDNPMLAPLLGDSDAAALFSAEVMVARMVTFERALALAEAAEGVIPAAAGAAIDAALAMFSPDFGGLGQGMARDGVVIPELVRQLRQAVGDGHGEHVHFGATSQDAMDTASTLALLDVLTLVGGRLDALASAFEALLARDGHVEVMAHTRMKVAIPVTAARKIESWRQPLARDRGRLGSAADAIAILHFGGAAGTLDALGSKGPTVAARLAAALGLRYPGMARHSERDGFVELANILSMITGSLGKFGQDVALASQSEIGEIRLTSGGGSSAMPHKSNPVKAETLVTHARFNPPLVSGVHHSLVHENERSGAAWMLEWMLLPQIAVACGAALRTALSLVDDLRFVDLKDR